MFINNATLIAAIRSAGYGICVKHYRYLKEDIKNFGYNGSMPIDKKAADKHFIEWDVAVRGGKTLILVKENGLTVGVGEAVCSKHDSYARREGVSLALNRVLVNNSTLGISVGYELQKMATEYNVVFESAKELCPIHPHMHDTDAAGNCRKQGCTYNIGEDYNDSI
jgi:hypothetical protein